MKLVIYYHRGALKFLGLLGVISLTACEFCSLNSKESIESETKRPWRSDETTVAGAINTSKKKITPHIGFNVPLDEPSKAISPPQKILKNEPPKEVKTLIDKKRGSIKVITE